ncbi:hypothetical protein AGR7C_pAt0079 [Agrobacterium deltaense Zutra 3/1]|uniref:Uncharacterized protein n=1 Tax=Agrobacterium deltaense Zutra 3/1 TaxID=1183427 RepID=A0A1S7S3K8_9HYPH|nr:hypothetical protein AGR7C_pAt0079 [Agrobacterium deltaense Zutra 3/1]
MDRDGLFSRRDHHGVDGLTDVTHSIHYALKFEASLLNQANTSFDFTARSLNEQLYLLRGCG